MVEDEMHQSCVVPNLLHARASGTSQIMQTPVADTGQFVQLVFEDRPAGNLVIALAGEAEHPGLSGADLIERQLRQLQPVRLVAFGEEAPLAADNVAATKARGLVEALRRQNQKAHQPGIGASGVAFGPAPGAALVSRSSERKRGVPYGLQFGVRKDAVALAFLALA